MKRSRGAAMLLASGVPDKRSIEETNAKKQCALNDDDAQATSMPLSRSLPQPPPQPSSSIIEADLNEESRSLLRIWGELAPSSNFRFEFESCGHAEVMLNALPLLNKRKEKVTITTLAPVVEAHTGKRFKSEHIQKIKYLYPHAFKWQFIIAPSRMDKQPEHQLLLQFDHQKGNRLSESEERMKLKERILAFHSSHDSPKDIPLAPLPPKETSSSIIDGVVKSLPSHPINSPPVTGTNIKTPSSAQSSRTALYPPPSATPLSPTVSVSCRPPMHKPSLQALPPHHEQAPSRARNPLLQRFMSAEALDLLEEAEAKRSFLPEIIQRRTRLNALVKLPTVFDMVRYIFGLGGRSPSLMDREEVVEKIKSKSTERGGISLQDARLQVDLLLQHAPEFIIAEGPSRILDRGVDVREGERVNGSMLRIDRSCELDKLRPRLVKLATDALAELKSSDPAPA